MGFNKLFSKQVMMPILVLVAIVGVVLFKFTNKAPAQPDSTVSAPAPEKTQSTNANVSMKLPDATQGLSGPQELDVTGQDASIQAQLDWDRKQQKETKDLKIKLEQTDLELQQQKAEAEINKLKKENMGAFNDPSESQNGLPEIRVNYIGGDSRQKEAIVSINGQTYQVKEKFKPTDNIQVVDITDSGVTLHFNTPQDMTKTFDYKPE
ncbi:MAG: hypothetical protein KGJ11_00235 [Candidatus Omnitrophica bacterium]|nr:hypothetical protein [Candidatus Omnitrophota bacterium]